MLKVIGVWFNNQYLKLRNLKLYFIKSNISTFSDFELYLFLTVFFATLKTRSEKNRGTGLVPVKSTGTGPEPVPARIPPRDRSQGVTSAEWGDHSIPHFLLTTHVLKWYRVISAV